MSERFIAFDIGGTKCAVSRWAAGDPPVMEKKIRFPTPSSPGETMALLAEHAARLAAGARILRAGISCGGPLDSARGIVLCPPNLPGWTDIDVTSPLSQALGAPVFLENDANACALAEWLWGAGKGFNSIVFLTMGTGMGAGLILDGRLYRGCCDMGGEVGHMRIADDGPVGYGKAGSFEGYCSGGGMARLAMMRLPAYRARTGRSSLLESREITAKSISCAADEGDEFALSVIEECGEKLGLVIANIIDMINPQRVIIGSVYGREPRFAPIVDRVLREEALPMSRRACEVVPAGLGESVGDYAAAAAAIFGRDGRSD